jgi:hypothetical protein
MQVLYNITAWTSFAKGGDCSIDLAHLALLFTGVIFWYSYLHCNVQSKQSNRNWPSVCFVAMRTTTSVLQLCREAAVSGVSGCGVSCEVRSNCIHELFLQNTDVIVGVLESQSGTEHLNRQQQWFLWLIVATRVYKAHAAFNPTTAQSTLNNHLSLYYVSTACFGLYMAILRESSNKGIQ